jgi:hypothetical protein
LEILNLLGALASLYLGYVTEVMTVGTYSQSLPLVMNLFPQNHSKKEPLNQVSGIHQKNIVLPKSSLEVQTFENNSPKTFWERILLTITDSWFFDWLEKYIKNEKKTALPNEKILVQKNLSKSRYSRVI